MTVYPTKAISARCPECDARIHFDSLPELGQISGCPECGTMLEVVRRNPLILDWAISEDDFSSEELYEYDEEDEYFLDDDFDEEDEIDFDEEEDFVYDDEDLEE